MKKKEFHSALFNPLGRPTGNYFYIRVATVHCSLCSQSLVLDDLLCDFSPFSGHFEDYKYQ